MIPTRTLAPLAAILGLVSCANQKDDYDTYDVADLYNSPDYGTPYAANQPVDPIYDGPPLFEDSTPLPPASTRPAASPRPAASRPAAPATRPATVHTVVRGDTLSGLSSRYGVSQNAIRSANNLRSNTIILGSRLTIPAGGRTAAAAPAARSRTHVVSRGDTLGGLSRRYGVSQDAIKRANNLRSDTIVLGRTLTIPAR